MQYNSGPGCPGKGGLPHHCGLNSAKLDDYVTLQEGVGGGFELCALPLDSQKNAQARRWHTVLPLFLQNELHVLQKPEQPHQA